MAAAINFVSSLKNKIEITNITQLKNMNHLSQLITNLFNSVSIRLILAITSVFILFVAQKDKLSAFYKSYKLKKGIRQIEKQVWWIE